MCEETRQHGSGRGRRKRTRTTGTSPAAYFTHNAKTHGGWTWTREPTTGQTTWTTPTGHTYPNPHPTPHP